jgi:N-acetylgalactosamine kinase
MNIKKLLFELNFILTSKNLENPYISEIRNVYQYDELKAFQYLKLLEHLLTGFYYTFPNNEDIYILRAPGRVNLIGEHLDYNGFPVLPIAIEKNIIFIFSQGKDDIVRVINYEKDYSYREFILSKDTKPFSMGDWGNYIKAGTIGLDIDLENDIKGFNALVYGDIPLASGLSSSSALVVASALTFMKSNNIQFDKLVIADDLARAEHYVGTMGGGMDQAISLLGEEGKALKINFFPLRTQSIKIPSGYSFVVANCCIKAPKTEKARLEYNRRPIECKIAAAFLKKELENKYVREFNINILGDLFRSENRIDSEILYQIANDLFKKDSYTVDHIADILNVSPSGFTDKFLKLKDGSAFPQPNDGFKLKQRFWYIMRENERVEKSVFAIQNGEMESLGKLMTEAHIDARDKYEISCPELDKLVEISLECGALGSRLTGAGFGGCCINLIKDNRTQDFINNVKKNYYNDFLFNHNKKLFDNIKNIDNQIFVCKPCRGSGFLFNF